MRIFSKIKPSHMKHTAVLKIRTSYKEAQIIKHLFWSSYKRSHCAFNFLSFAYGYIGIKIVLSSDPGERDVAQPGDICTAAVFNFLLPNSKNGLSNNSNRLLQFVFLKHDYFHTFFKRVIYLIRYYGLYVKIDFLLISWK